MARKKKEDAAASPEVTDAAEAQDVELASPETGEVATPRRKMSGEELKAMLRQQRREARLAERGY